MSGLCSKSITIGETDKGDRVFSRIPYPGSWVTNEVGELGQEAPSVVPGRDVTERHEGFTVSQLLGDSTDAVTSLGNGHYMLF